MKRISYKWKQLSQWDVAHPDAYLMYREVKTGISFGTCTFMLVEVTDRGHGYMRTEFIDKDDVTKQMIEEANE